MNPSSDIVMCHSISLIRGPLCRLRRQTLFTGLAISGERPPRQVETHRRAHDPISSSSARVTGAEAMTGAHSE